MGNSLGGKRAAKVMKINGETMKLKTPIYAGEVTKDHPGHVLLESEAVKHYGVRAKPLEPQQELKPKRLYFLVELPKFPEEKGPRRVRSGIQMSAKDRLESLMLARRSVSDLTIMKPSFSSTIVPDHDDNGKPIITSYPSSSSSSTSSSSSSSVRLKMRLPKSQVEKMMMESKDGAEAAAKIFELYLENNNKETGDSAAATDEKLHNNWKDGGERDNIINPGLKSREKRVGFLPITEGEIRIAVS